MKLDDVEKAVEYLASTDETHAKITASQESMKDAEKHTKGKFVMEHSDLPVSKAEHAYYASASFTEILKLKKEGLEHQKELTNKRQTAVLRIEIWRTLEASRRKGNV
jgi:uncharacterized protein YdaT|tara:strand:- start:172 stop:492 length:321 start_codon:yes stop_codon:yes gene_type:complete